MRTICGVKSRAPGYAWYAQDHEYFQLLYLLEGELWLDVHNLVTPIHAHTLLVLPYRATFRVYCAERGYTAVHFSILDELSDGYTGEATIVPGTPALHSLADLIKDEVDHPGDNTGALRQHLGESLGILAVRMLRGSMAFAYGLPVSAKTWAQTVRQYIEETCCASQPLMQSLAGIPLSYQQLARHFVAVYGVTPKQYQMHCRIEEAKRLLTTTRLSITALAPELGFASSQHFAQVFTHYTGMSPSQYRAMG